MPGLTKDEMYRILTEPETNLLRQQKELLKVRSIRDVGSKGLNRLLLNLISNLTLNEP